MQQGVGRKKRSLRFTAYFLLERSGSEETARMVRLRHGLVLCRWGEQAWLAAVGAEDSFEHSSGYGEGFFRNGEAELPVASRVDVSHLEAF